MLQASGRHLKNEVGGRYLKRLQPVKTTLESEAIKKQLRGNELSKTFFVRVCCLRRDTEKIQRVNQLFLLFLCTQWRLRCEI